MSSEILSLCSRRKFYGVKDFFGILFFSFHKLEVLLVNEYQFVCSLLKGLQNYNQQFESRSRNV